MALEQVFECPKTLTGRQGRPSGKQLEALCHWLPGVK